MAGDSGDVLDSWSGDLLPGWKWAEAYHTEGPELTSLFILGFTSLFSDVIRRIHVRKGSLRTE